MGSFSTGIGRALNPFAGGWNAKQTSAGLLSPEQAEYLNKMLPMLYGMAFGSSNTALSSALENVLGTSRQSAEQNFSQNTLPQIMASAGTLHSGYTGNKVGQTYNQMQMGLNEQEAQSRYGMQQSQIQQGIQGLLAALGVTTKENIVDKPGMLEGLFGGGLNKYGG